MRKRTLTKKMPSRGTVATQLSRALDDIDVAIRQYVWRPLDWHYHVLTLWAMAALTSGAWTWFPLLGLGSPDGGYGKTTTLQVLEAITGGHYHWRSGELVQRAKQDIATELDQTRDELRRKAGTLAVNIAEKVLRSKLNNEQKELATTAYIAEADQMSFDDL